MMKNKKFFKKLILLIEAGLAYFTYYLFKLLPVDVSTAIGSFIGFHILGNIPLQRKREVIQNIMKVFPNYSLEQASVLYKKSCSNFCSTIAQMPHILTLYKLQRVKVDDKYNVLPTIYNSNSLFFSAHTGNWEFIGYPFIAKPIKAKQYVIYKAPGNPYLVDLFATMRQYGFTHNMITLNKQIIIQLYTSFKKTPTNLIMLVDQRIKEGIKVPFLGEIAYTSPILPMLAIKQHIPLIPLRSIKKNNKEFIVEIGKPVMLNEVESKLPESEQIALLTTKMNDVISNWVKEYPEQWFWLHRRW